MSAKGKWNTLVINYCPQAHVITTEHKALDQVKRQAIRKHFKERRNMCTANFFPQFKHHFLDLSKQHFEGVKWVLYLTMLIC